jgi:hypothetical protein
MPSLLEAGKAFLIQKGLYSSVVIIRLDRIIQFSSLDCAIKPGYDNNKNTGINSRE